MKRFGLAVALAGLMLVLAAGPALAGHCTNADKNAAAGVQAVIDINTGQIVWISDGLQHRIDQGIVDPVTGEGFSGLLGFDVNGDGIADASTYIVGPNDELPDQAQINGAQCHGVVSIFTLFTQCLT
jgi:hypothetical protein